MLHGTWFCTNVQPQLPKQLRILHDFEKEIIQVKTIRVIEKEEELTINYNGDWNDNKKIWFEML